MKIDWIESAPRPVLALAKRLSVDALFVVAGAMTGGIVYGVTVLVSVMPVISLLGAVWFLVIQPALH